MERQHAPPPSSSREDGWGETNKWQLLEGRKVCKDKKFGPNEKNKEKDGEGGILARSHTATPSRLPQDPTTDSKQKRFRSRCAGNAVGEDSHFHDTHTQHKARRGSPPDEVFLLSEAAGIDAHAGTVVVHRRKEKTKKARLAWGKRRRYTRSSAHPASTRRMAHNWSKGACVHCGRKLMLA